MEELFVRSPCNPKNDAVATLALAMQTIAQNVTKLGSISLSEFGPKHETKKAG